MSLHLQAAQGHALPQCHVNAAGALHLLYVPNSYLLLLLLQVVLSPRHRLRHRASHLVVAGVSLLDFGIMLHAVTCCAELQA
jgi:hypothetical protein